MKVVVGSTNPVKVSAVKMAFERFFDCDVVVDGVSVESGVSDQPFSENESVLGAKNRARNAMKLCSGCGYDYAVGLEGGVFDMDGELFECAWVCVLSKSGDVGLGGGLYFRIPKTVADRLRAGEELGSVMDDLLGEIDVKKKGGAIAYFTNNKLTRTDAYVNIVLHALVVFGERFARLDG